MSFMRQMGRIKMLEKWTKQHFYEELNLFNDNKYDVIISMMLDSKHQLVFLWYRKVGFKYFNSTAEIILRDLTKQGYHQYLMNNREIKMKKLNSRNKLYVAIDKIIREVIK